MKTRFLSSFWSIVLVGSLLSCRKSEDDTTATKVNMLVHDTSRWIIQSLIIVKGNSTEQKQAEFANRELRFLKYVYVYRLSIGIDEPLVQAASVPKDSIEFISECYNSIMCTNRAKLLNGVWKIQFVSATELAFNKATDSTKETMVWKRK